MEPDFLRLPGDTDRARPQPRPGTGGTDRFELPAAFLLYTLGGSSRSPQLLRACRVTSARACTDAERRAQKDTWLKRKAQLRKRDRRTRETAALSQGDFVAWEVEAVLSLGSAFELQPQMFVGQQAQMPAGSALLA